VNTTIGPIKLSEGISRFNAVTYLYACIICIGILAGLNFIQPYILSVVLEIPRSEQGTVSGSLAFMQEIIAIILVSFFGILSDRIGRRPVMVFGTMVVALGFALFPYAENMNELYIYRSIFAIGAAALSSVLAIIVNDYPTEQSRGKFVSLHSVLNALGVAIFAAFLGRLPTVFTNMGYDPITAGRFTMLFVAGLAFLSGLIFAVGLKGGTPENQKEKLGFKHLMATAIESMRNPRISLAFAATLLARADVSVNGIFISLWAATSAIDLGLTTGEAFKQVVPVIVITNLLSIVWAFLFGSIIDRINRVTAMVVAMALGVIAYGLIVFVDTPLNYSYLPIFILISASAIGTVIATASLIGQEAPVRERGSVIGVSAFFGACGILVATSVGGLLFDTFGPKGPFLLICFTHAVILFGAIFVRIKSPGEYFGDNKETV
jgi:MFS family permease|tara:strand:+ start:1887 stop:3191 length:1305 start_codon:yes stop_codon:yes gene_type:complete